MGSGTLARVTGIERKHLFNESTETTEFGFILLKFINNSSSQNEENHGLDTRS